MVINLLFHSPRSRQTGRAVSVVHYLLCWAQFILRWVGERGIDVFVVCAFFGPDFRHL
jgi:hypothetical protein